MRGKVVSEKVKRHKVDSVNRLIQTPMTVEKACRRMRISKRTYYQYRKEMSILNKLELSDQRVQPLTEFQKAILWFMMGLDPYLSLNDFVNGINSFQLYYNFSKGFDIEKEENLVTRYRVSEYLSTIKRRTIYRIERANNPRSREIIIDIEIKETSEMHYFLKECKKQDLGIVRVILLPEKKR